MEVRFLWLLVLGAVVLASVAGSVWRRRLGTRRPARTAVANTAALTALPEYRRALRSHRLRVLLLAVSAAVLAGAALVGAARPVDTSVEQPTARNRDIILCLDVSGSMSEYDAALVATFRELAEGFAGERVGLVIFNSSAATVFPLTDDYAFVQDELDLASEALAGGPRLEDFLAGTYTGRGTSLIGDGLATCVSSFDRVDTLRPRSLVLATDNHRAGPPLVTLESAAELAKARGVRVYGLNPEERGHDLEADVLERTVTGTGGRYFVMGDPGAVAGIVSSVQRQEAALIESGTRTLRTDDPATAIGLAAVGLAGVIAASRRWRA